MDQRRKRAKTRYQTINSPKRKRNPKNQNPQLMTMGLSLMIMEFEYLIKMENSKSLNLQMRRLIPQSTILMPKRSMDLESWRRRKRRSQERILKLIFCLQVYFHKQKKNQIVMELCRRSEKREDKSQIWLLDKVVLDLWL